MELKDYIEQQMQKNLEFAELYRKKMAFIDQMEQMRRAQRQAQATPRQLSGIDFLTSPPPINNSQNSNNKKMNTKYQRFSDEIVVGQVLQLEYPGSWGGSRRFIVEVTDGDKMARGILFYGEEESSGKYTSGWTIYRKQDGNWSADGTSGFAYIDISTIISKPKVGMDTVILAQEKKDQILAAISQVDLQDKIFKQWGFEEVFEKGVAISLLFYGIPGTGKTLMAQAIADQLKMKLTIVGTGDIETSEPGGAERNITALFAKNKGKKNIILFDECDSLLSSREDVGTIMAAQINCLLSEIEKYDGVVIFTTNRLGKLDPALERRITAKINFPFPDTNQRVAIWKRMIPEKAPIAKDVDFDVIAKKYKIAGGNIKNAVLNSARKAAYDGMAEITMECFESAAKKEMESIKAFSDAFEDQDQTRARSNSAMRRDMGKISINKEKLMSENVGKEKRSKKDVTSLLGGNN